MGGGGPGRDSRQRTHTICLQRIIGKHAKVLMSMCQQHAGMDVLPGEKWFKGLGRRGLVPKPFVLRQSSFSRVQQKIHKL